MFDGRWRNGVDRTTGPVGQALHRHGITADVLTATGLLSATATAVLVATGHLHWAIVMLIITGLHDLLDGPVAKAAGTASVRGAFFDSVTDRVADAVLMLGASWQYLLNQGEGHLCPSAHGHPGGDRSSSPTSGPRRSRSACRPRVASWSAASGCSSSVSASWSAAIFVPVLWILLVLTSFTAIARFVKVWRRCLGP